jgi:hypothetical protein
MSTDTITLTSGSTITIDPTYYYSTASVGSNYSISGLSTAAQVNTISTISIDDFKITMPEEWVNCLPDFDRIEKMCKEYPGLRIAYEQFKTVYTLVKGDYDTPKDQRPKP